MLVGQALMSFIGIIDQFFASHLDAGSIATLSYANRILALVLGLGAIAISRASLPVFSRLQAQKDAQLHLRLVTTQWASLLLVFGVGAMIVGWWSAPWVVKLLFERGAFVAQNTLAVTQILRYGLVQLPFYFVGILFVSLLTSQSRFKIVTIIGTVNLIVKIIATFLLVERMGVSGIMLATSLMLIVSTLLSGAVLYFDLNKGARNENSKSI
jgi:peptidoglycan biosynthesis protein MviN/MurJ (putative lipid II flippase)